MKEVLLVVSLVSVLLLTGCNKNEVSNDINNVPETIDNQSQEIIESNEKVEYSNEQLIEMVRNYRKARGEFIPEFIVVDGEKDNIVTIHLYEEVEEHIATTDWYYIDRRTGKGKNFLEESVDLNNVDVPNKYTEITEELENGSCLFITKAIKNDNDTYTLQGVIFSHYLLSQNEVDEIVRKGTMDIENKTYRIEIVSNREDNSSDSRYVYLKLYSDNDQSDNPMYSIIKDSSLYYLERTGVQLSYVWKMSNEYRQITVDKDTICEMGEFYDPYGLIDNPKTVEELYESMFKAYENKLDPNSTNPIPSYTFEFENGKCVKIIPWFGI